jgi:hypothetical protein
MDRKCGSGGARVDKNRRICKLHPCTRIVRPAPCFRPAQLFGTSSAIRLCLARAGAESALICALRFPCSVWRQKENVMSSEKEDRIRTRAYQIWDRQGRTDGQHEEHWTQASRELESEDTGPAGASAKPTTADDPTRGTASSGGASGFSGTQSGSAAPSSPSSSSGQGGNQSGGESAGQSSAPGAAGASRPSTTSPSGGQAGQMGSSGAPGGISSGLQRGGTIPAGGPAGGSTSPSGPSRN